MKHPKTSKSWAEKLSIDLQPKLVQVPEKWASRAKDAKMLVPSPLLIDATIKKIPSGRLATVNTIRDYLAHQYKAEMTCPLTTGIFINIAANKAEEDQLHGESVITPWWRVLKEGGALNEKFPGGAKRQARYLKKEGFSILKDKINEHLFVKDYQHNLVDL